MMRQRFMALAVAAVLGSPAWAMIQIGTHYPAEIDTPVDYPGAPEAGQEVVAWSHVLQHPGATYIAIHFVDFDLGPGDVLTISDGLGGQAYTMTGRGKMNAGTFWAQHVKGDTAVLSLTVTSAEGGRGFIIDEYAAGDIDLATTVLPLSIAGPDDRENAICYETSHPTAYERGRAVVRLLSNGSSFCSGSLVSPGNHVLTNNHCIGTATKALNTDYEFMAEAPTCESENCSNCWPGVIHSGGTMIRQSGQFDYALIQINEGDPASEYGYLEIDNRPPILGEQIFIPQHGGGFAKLFALYSTQPEDTGGVARIQSVTHSPCVGGPFEGVGYYADTEGGTSGSPVIAMSSHKIIALHHCGGSMNGGIPIHLIYPQIQDDLLRLSTHNQIAPGAIAVASSSAQSGQGPENAIDAYLGSLWTSASTGGEHWLRLDLGLEAPVTGFRVRHASASGESVSLNTRWFVIESATSPSGPWAVEFVGDNPGQAEISVFSFPGATSLRHVRLRVIDPGDTTAARITEFEVMSEPIMTAGTPPGTNVAPQSISAQASSVFGPDWGPEKAIDGIVSEHSKWVSADVNPPHWLRLDLGAARKIAGFVLHQASAGGEITGLNARDLAFQSARSAAGPWYTEARVITSGLSDTESRVFISPKQLRHVRLVINIPTAFAWDRYARIPQFEVIEFEGIAANFTATPTSGYAPLAVQFTDTSLGDVFSWSWSFGDGGTSTSPNPAHTYTVPGVYDVSLTVTGPEGVDTITRPSHIHVQAIIADFDADGDVDLDDFAHLQACLDAPGVPITDPACANADFSDDGSVDTTDLAAFLNCLSGANVPPNIACVP